MCYDLVRSFWALLKKYTERGFECFSFSLLLRRCCPISEVGTKRSGGGDHELQFDVWASTIQLEFLGVSMGGLLCGSRYRSFEEGGARGSFVLASLLRFMGD